LPGKPVVAVKLSRTAVTDAGLEELPAFKKITTPSLNKRHMTDAGVRELQKPLPKCKIQ